ncbi:hypothetical protein K2173_021155 [Erythroxylum novogranatense]|uniref:Uncharacterized protein n=1 Tax=Erythroxylum novogranatense TaxID=1862640 RepID=A0AAV8TPN9_9ROSI|nr:hypothetical protein K2173_021155 [Erythroxylum novogranatense]
MPSDVFPSSLFRVQLMLLPGNFAKWRERNLLNSKLIEFENLPQNPYVAPLKSALHGAVRFPVGTSGAATAAGQSSASTPFSNLSQSNVQLNAGHSTPANSAIGQSTLLPNSVQTSNAFGSRLSPNVFGQPVSLSSSGQTANAFGTNKFLSGDAGFSSSGIIGDQGNSFSSSAIQMQNTPPLSIQHHLFTDGTNIDPNPVGQADRNTQLQHEQKRENISGEDSIWLKENWSPGEIPEEAPPEAIIR